MGGGLERWADRGAVQANLDCRAGKTIAPLGTDMSKRKSLYHFLLFIDRRANLTCRRTRARVRRFSPGAKETQPKKR